MEQQDRAYLSILGWPRGFAEDRRVEALVAGAGMDPYLAGQMARRPTPAIVHMFDAVVRDEVLAALHAMGVLALAPTRLEMRAYPEPILAREVERFPNTEPPSFAVQTRDGGAWTFTAPDVRLVVTGTVRQVGKVMRHKAGGPNCTAAWMAGGAEGVVIAGAIGAMSDAPGGWGANTTRNARAVPMIDLHVSHGGRIALVRLVGPTTRPGLIGEERGRPSLLDKSDPVEAWRALLPGVAFETGFDAFNTPSDVEQMAASAGQGSSRLNPIAFHFFSLWSAMIDRGVRGW